MKVQLAAVERAFLLYIDGTFRCLLGSANTSTALTSQFPGTRTMLGQTGTVGTSDRIPRSK